MGSLEQKVAQPALCFKIPGFRTDYQGARVNAGRLREGRGSSSDK